ncbi:MAG: hypothetical protein MJ220_02375 [Bacilli bacterium]|nr:hypothetical protein [Bacilli bacterium]
MKWEIWYYKTEEDYKEKKVSYKEYIDAPTKAEASIWAANRKRVSGYAYAEVFQKL